MATLETHYHHPGDMYCNREAPNGQVNMKIFTCDLLSVVQNIITGIASITPLTNNANAWKIEGEKGKPVVTIQYAATPGSHYLNLNMERNKEQWDSYMLERDQQNSQISNATVLANDSTISDLCKSNSFNPHNAADGSQSVATILHEAITGNALVISDQNMNEKTIIGSAASNIFDPKNIQKKSTDCTPEMVSYKSVNPDKTVVVSKFVQSTTVKRMHKDGNSGQQNSEQLCTRLENLSRCSILSGHDEGWKTVSATQAAACKTAVATTNSMPCRICDKTFSCISFRAVHDEPHTGQKPFRCSYCPKRFTHGSMLISHERSHTVERPFACMYCSKTFTRKNVLEIHKRIHTGEKPYKCSYCSKTFAIKHHKVNHERCHTGEKPFACSYCSKMFSRKSSLKQHESLHIRDNPFVACTVPKGFPGT